MAEPVGDLVVDLSLDAARFTESGDFRRAV